ncbi:MAG: CcoQ/FixQ family Cbb3-type cytochrome c oxidase assembly chaperone [Boseongicola sp.]|nr:MAG: CcoQ/FixQ family Cbb3-type cytochrome c oxidase assembly chaperone [Boseongicola sp.]
METYSVLREFADSWFLIGMFAFFVGTWIFAFWPSLKSSRDDAASIPMRDEIAPRDNDCAVSAQEIDNLKGAKNG